MKDNAPKIFSIVVQYVQDKTSTELKSATLDQFFELGMTADEVFAKVLAEVKQEFPAALVMQHFIFELTPEQVQWLSDKAAEVDTA